MLATKGLRAISKGLCCRNVSIMSTKKKSPAYVVGVGMTKFDKPREDGKEFPQLAKEAGRDALLDAGLEFEQVQQAVAGYVFGDSTKGQRAVYELGMTGIPIYNVNNNCATGSSALLLAQQMVVGGMAECVLAIGFEKMQKGALQLDCTGVNPLGVHISTMANFGGSPINPVTPWMFGTAALEHMKLYGTTKEQFARVAEKNHRHSQNNSRAQFQQVYTLEEIMESKEIFDPLTKLQCSPTSDGAAAAIVCSKDFVKAHNLTDTAVEIASMKMATDVTKSFESAMGVCGYHMTQKAAREALEEADVKPADVQLVELHDCFSSNELMTYEALGLCEPGEGGKLIDDGQVTFGGKWVVNPSGGLISKGHPLGATGLAQCAEICWQLRKDEEVEARQVEGAKIGLQHNLGVGGACVVGVYKR